MAFLDEVAEQGKALRNLAEYYQGEGDSLLCWIGRAITPRTRSVIFTGMGTSEYVADVIKPYMSVKSRAPVVFWEAGELLHYGIESIRDDDLIIAVSQSGESVETRRVMEELSYHRGVIAVTNNPESSMAKMALENIPILAGEEATISTKTYSNCLALMILLSRAFFSEDWNSILSKLTYIADEMDDFYVSRRHEIEIASELFREAHTVYFVSRGLAMSAAKQAALTFQEGSHVYTCALPGGSMRHGPFEIVGAGHHAVLFAPEGHGGDLLRNMAVEMAELGSKVILFTAKPMKSLPNLASIHIKPGDDDYFALACAVPQELLLERMASQRGWTAGVFRRGGKITTQE